MAGRIGSLGADDLQRAADLDDLDLIPGMQPVLSPQLRRDGQYVATAPAARHQAPGPFAFTAYQRPRCTTSPNGRRSGFLIGASGRPAG